MSILRRGKPSELVIIGRHPRVVGLLPPGARARFLDAGDEQEIRRLRNSPGCDEVWIALAADEMPRLSALLEAIRMAPVPVRVVVDVPGAAAFQRRRDVVLIDLGDCPADRISYRFGKRAMDLALAALALLFGALPAAATALGLRLHSGAPVLFRQQRIGRSGRRFTLYKFRTLPLSPSEVSDRQWVGTAPPEANRFQRWLRRAGLDEWPQFWNVMRGEMSVVGPRPERPHFAEQFGEALEAYSLRQRMRPGITGWAQVHGLTGDCDISRRLECDLDYLRNWSVGLDLKILLLTPRRMWQRSRSGLSEPATVPKIRNHAESV